MKVTMPAGLISVVLALTLPHGAHLDGHWQLEHGYRALIYEQHRLPAGNGWARRTFELLHWKHVLRRWHDSDEVMRATPRDITGDGIRDVLVLDYIDGSGACENYRLYAGPRQRLLWRLGTVCEDTTRVKLWSRGIAAWTAIDGSHYTGSIHCCWRRWRRSEWRWERGRLRLVQQTVTTHPPPWRDPGMPR